MNNLSKKQRKEFEKMKERMSNTLTNSMDFIESTLNADSVIDNIVTLRVQISLLKEFEEELLNFLGDVICQSKQHD